jgi:hypothetical protein
VIDKREELELEIGHKIDVGEETGKTSKPRPWILF